MKERRCLSCGQTRKTKTISARGYLWHVPCANVRQYADGTQYVDFPSDGKIAPATIMTGGMGVSSTARLPVEKTTDEYLEYSDSVTGATPRIKGR